MFEDLKSPGKAERRFRLRYFGPHPDDGGGGLKLGVALSGGRGYKDCATLFKASDFKESML